VDIDVISVGVETLVEDEGRVHEGTGVHETALLCECHLLNVKDETPIEDLEGQCALTAEYHYLFVSDLVGDTHVGWNPLLLVNCWQLSPNVSLNVITLHSVHDSLLVNSPSKGEDVLILEGAESNSRSRNVEWGNILPLIFQSIISFTVSVDLVVHKGSHNIDESLDGAQWVVCSGISEWLLLLQQVEQFIISVASVQVLVSSLDVPSNQIDAGVLSGNGSRVQGHLVVHLDLSLLKLAVLDSVDLYASLIPLEGMQSLRDVGNEAILYVVVQSEVPLNEVGIFFDYLVRILLKESL
jgi:hypothetical protein